ncbi:hypothetical protein [Photobacterium satsumensis]|uniref:hypothetical protein n=1 Tax=Photobacterium satsumensis TaxID=2910239 RepID=UPI003D0D0481
MNTALIFLIPALLGAQLVLTLVLTKGEICPGQRGRVHKTLPVLLLGWLVVALFQPYAFLPLGALGYFTLKVKTGKTRDAGPLNVFYVANVLAFFVWFSMLLTLTLPVAVMSLVSVALFGSLLAHLLLTQARTRLQAFHRLLPFAGFISAMVSVLCLLWLAYQFDESQLASLTTNVVASLVLLVAGLLVWSMHLLTGKTVNRWQLVIAAGILMLSANMQMTMIL